MLCHPQEPAPGTRAQFGSINATFAGTSLVFLPYPSSPQPLSCAGGGGVTHNDTQPITFSRRICPPPLLQQPPGTAAPQQCTGARRTQCVCVCPLEHPVGQHQQGGVAPFNPTSSIPLPAQGVPSAGAGVSRCLLPLWGVAPRSRPFSGGTGLNAAAPEGWGLLRSLIPAYFSEV